MIRQVFAALIAVAVTSSAGAPVEGVRAIEQGKPLSVAAGKSTAEYFSFFGVPGAHHVFVAESKGPIWLAVFAPTGEEILSQAGSGKVELDYVAPLVEPYLLTVMRGKPSQAFRLTMSQTEPTIAEAAIANASGYKWTEDGKPRQTCWLKPGVKLRSLFREGYMDFSLLADRDSASVQTHTVSGALVRSEVNYAIKGDEIVRTWSYDDRPSKTFRSSLDEQAFALDESNEATFATYLCDPEQTSTQ